MLHVSKRRLEVLRLIAMGFNREQIGQSTGLSNNSIKWFIGELMYELGANNREHLVAISIALGFINPREIVSPIKEPCNGAA